MLIIMNDPAGATGRHAHEWDYTATVQDNIARHLRSGGGCAVRWNGDDINPATDPRMDRPPSIADEVTVIRRPEGFDPLTWTLIAIAASVAVTVALMPKVPRLTSAAGKDSPNNRLAGQTNIARPYQAIPDVYGLRRIWPDLIQPAVVEYVDNVKLITEWMVASYGIGTITAVQYAETPFADIAEASYEVFEPVPVDGYPERGTTTLSDVLEAFEVDDVNGQELTYPEPYPVMTPTGDFVAVTGATTFTLKIPNSTANIANLKGLAPFGTARVVCTLPGPVAFDEDCTVASFVVSGSDCTFTFSGVPVWASDVTATAIATTITPNGTAPQTVGPFTLPLASDRIRWNTVFLRGLKGSVTIRAEWWKVDGSGAEISGTRQSQDNTYTADTFDQQFRTNNATPTAGLGRYRMQFTRLTPQIGDQGTDVAKLEEVYAVRYYATKVLPGCTAFRVTTRATQEATGFADRKFNLRWNRHVRTLTTNTLSASRNFARCMAHVWTLAGGDMADLDTDRLAEINADLGETSPLLRFDASFDDEDLSLGQRMQLAANAARCLLWYDGEKWTVTRDQARAVPRMQLDYRNLARGGESSISYASHLPASNDGIELEYVDETTQAKKAYIRLSIASGSVVVGRSANPQKIQLIGCATTAQAENRARLEARRLLYQRINVTDTGLRDAAQLGPGDLVRWVDPADLYGDDGLQAGEVLAISGDEITTSEPVDWLSETSGRILLTGTSGAYLGAPVLCYPAAGGRIRLGTVPAGIFVADATRQCGSRYAFAAGVTESEMQASGLYTVTAARPDSRGNTSLALAAYDSRMYEDD